MQRAMKRTLPPIDPAEPPAQRLQRDRSFAAELVKVQLAPSSELKSFSFAEEAQNAVQLKDSKQEELSIEHVQVSNPWGWSPEARECGPHSPEQEFERSVSPLGSTSSESDRVSGNQSDEDYSAIGGRTKDKEPAVASGPLKVIPFSKTCYVGKEVEYTMQSLASGKIAGDGPFGLKCQKLLEQSLGVKKALLTTSCTDALEMCALLVNIQPGDEVIVPSFTFVSSINAFVLYGAKPVFVDVHPDTLNIDERLLEQALTPRTKAVVVVHYGGHACEMDTIVDICSRHKVSLIEDQAHALFGSYKGRPLGTFGCLSTLSFHETKNITCGEGGALLINDTAIVDRAEVLRNKGTNRHKFMAGKVDKYTWVDRGSSFLPSDILAAVLLAQLEAQQAIQLKRGNIWRRYRHGLLAWAAREGVVLPSNPDTVHEGFVHSYHIFHMLLPSKEFRSKLGAHLGQCGVKASSHYHPLHLSPMGMEYGGFQGQCPVTEDITERMVRLPLFTDLSEEEICHVVDSVTSAKCS